MKRIMLKIKPFQETLKSGYCGPASLKILLSYYGIEKTEKELVKLCKTKKDLGVNDEAIHRATKQLRHNNKIRNIIYLYQSFQMSDFLV